VKIVKSFFPKDGNNVGLNLFSNDGRQLLTTPGAGMVRIWDTQSGQQTRFPIRDFQVLCMAFNGDGSLMAVGDISGIISILNAQTHHILWVSSKANFKVVNTIWFTPDSRYCVAAHSNGTVSVWDTESGVMKSSFMEHTKLVQSLRFDADGKTIVSASKDGSIRTWDLESGRELEVSEISHIAERDLSFQSLSPDLRKVAVGFSNGSILLLDRQSGETQDLPKGSDEITNVFFSEDGTCVFAVEGNKKIRVLDGVSGRELTTIDSSDSFFTVALSPDGERIATSSYNGESKIWAPVELNAENSVALSTAHEDLVIQATFNTDGDQFVTVSFDGTAKVWNTDSLQLISIFKDHKHELLSAAFSPDGRLVASVSTRGNIRVWETETAKQVFHHEMNSDDFFNIADGNRGGIRGVPLNFSGNFSSSYFAPDPFAKLVVYDGSQMVVHETQKWNRTVNLVDSSTVAWPVISPNGQLVAGITDDLHDIPVWDMETGGKRFSLQGHHKSAYWVEFSKDGKHMVTSSVDKTAIVWDAGDGGIISKLIGHSDYLILSRFSPDGERIATASADGTAKIWNVSTGELLSTFSRAIP